MDTTEYMKTEEFKMNKNYMSERKIESYSLDHLKSYGFSVIKCEGDLPDGTGRSDRSQVILPQIFSANPIINFTNPKNNDYTVVSQMWIESKYGSIRRPDLLLFINGLPVVFIELKNNHKDVKEGYDCNLIKYRDEIPHLFGYNLLCVLSNGVETRLGKWTADYNDFSNWQTPPKDEWRIKRDGKLTWQNLKFFIRDFCQPSVLIKYLGGSVLGNAA
jgi:type I restriction enzyme R subunit